MFTKLSDVTPLLRRRTVDLDSFSIALHSRLSPVLFILCALVLTGYHMFVKALTCTKDNHLSVDYVEAYCLAVSTQSNLENHDREGLYPFLGHNTGEKVLHSYYQWTILALFCLALVSRVPHMLWKYMEGNLLRTLLPEDTIKLQQQGEVDEVKRYIKRVGVYFEKSQNHNRHTSYAFWFILCELLNLGSVVLIAFAINLILSGQFFSYGVDCVSFYLLGDPTELSVEPSVKLFPTVARCIIYRVGASGSDEKLEETCVLLMNMINKQIFLVIWVWLLVLLLVLSVSFIHRILTMFCPAERNRQIEIQTGKSQKFRSISHKLSYGDWLILLKLLQHFQFVLARELLDEVVARHGGYLWIELDQAPNLHQGTDKNLGSF